MNTTNFNVRFKELRLSKNLSQQEIGSIIGLSKQAVNGIEQCRRSTTIDKLIALAHYYNVSTDYLLGLTNNPKVNK